MKRTQKQRSEEVFHDTFAQSISIESIMIPQKTLYGYPELSYAHKQFGNVHTKKLLDLGCGYGETAAYWGLNGANTYGIDISYKMIMLAKKLAKKHHITNKVRFKQAVAEKLPFKNEYFDFIFGDGILHHVDMKKSLLEIQRVLKKSGTAIFIEPLPYNPFIKLYRILASGVRTDYEKPLTFTDIKKIKTIFPNTAHTEFHCMSLLIFMLFFVVGINPNKQRYWKKFRYLDGLPGTILHILNQIDRLLLSIFPFLRYLCWNTVIILHKENL